MRKIDLLIGFIIGLGACFLGTFLFITLFTEYGFVDGLAILKSGGYMGKVITLGAILTLIIFFLLLKLNKELMARGVVLATFVLAVITFFV